MKLRSLATAFDNYENALSQTPAETKIENVGQDNSRDRLVLLSETAKVFDDSDEVRRCRTRMTIKDSTLYTRVLT